MKDKNNGPTHSQIIGIIWLSIALLLIAVAIFFSRSQSGGEHKNSIADSTVEAVLLQKEDSLYHSRRGNTAKHSQTAFSSHKTSYADRQRQPDSSHCNTTAAPARRQPLTVELNGVKVVDNTVLENYWDRSQPIFPVEQIELQCHGDPVEFKNIFIREL